MHITTAQCTRAALLVAASLVAVPLASGKTSHARAETQAEIQVALCSEPEQVVRALDLAPRAAVRETWLFDDAALTLFGLGLRVRLRATDGGGELTLKAAIEHSAHPAGVVTTATAALVERAGRLIPMLHARAGTVASALVVCVGIAAIGPGVFRAEGETPRAVGLK